MRGMVLVPALFVVFLLTALAGAFLRLLLAHTRESVAATTGTQTFYVAEAGVNAAIAEIQSRVDAGGDGLGTVSASFAGGAYQVVATETQPNREWRIEAAASLGSSTRSIEAVLRSEPTSLFLRALFSNDPLTVSGNISTDSYDSRDGSYASQASHVDPVTGITYANPHGDIGSNQGINASGSITVMGNATPGPGYSVSTSGNAYIEGSTTCAPHPVSLPVPTYAPVGPSLGAFNIGGATTRTLGPGTYHYSSFRTSGRSTARCQGNVTLYVDGNFLISGLSSLVILPGSHVTIQHGSGSFQVTGNGVANLGHNPLDFMVYSSTAGRVENSGNSDFYGAIYAPNADTWLTGNSDTYGSVVGRVLHVTGNSDFHYDEALAEVPGPGPGTYTIRSWREIGVP